MQIDKVTANELRFYIGSAIMHLSCCLETIKKVGQCPPPTAFGHNKEELSPLGYMFTTPKYLIKNLVLVLTQEHCSYAIWIGECKYIKSASDQQIKSVYRVVEEDNIFSIKHLLKSLSDGILIQIFDLQNGLIATMVVDVDQNKTKDIDIAQCTIYFILASCCESAWEDVPSDTKQSLKENNIYVYEDSKQYFNGNKKTIQQQLHKKLFGTTALEA